MSKPFIVQRAGALSLVTLMAGIAMTVVAILDLLGIAFTELGNWDYWLLMGGILFVLIGGVWFFLHVKNIRKFRELMEEKSKANFLKKLDDVEYLAWRLPMKYEEELAIKKKGFGLK